VPRAGATLDFRDAAVAGQDPAGAPEAAQETLVDRGDIHVHHARFMGRGGDGFGAQQRRHR
jgi:hypothetical protein